MNKISDFIKSTGDFLGNNIEKLSKTTGDSIGNTLEKNNHPKIAKGLKDGSNLIGKGASVTTKSIFGIASITLDSGIKVGKVTGRFLKEKAVKKEVRIYGESKEFYKDKFVEAEYKITDK